MGLFGLTASNKVAFKKLREDGCTVSIQIEVPFAKVEEETHTQLLRIQSRARLPGFRPGKAPIALVQKHFMGSAREEVFQGLIRRHVPEALKELALEPVASPAVSDLAFKPNEPLRLTVQVEIAPRVAAKDYAKIKARRSRSKPNDEELARRLEELREGNARLERSQAEAAGKTHYAIIDFSAARDGKPLPGAKGEAELVDMSSDQTIPGLCDGLLGMKRGETKQFSVQIEDKPAQMTATLKEIKDKILPPLDAEFAKDLGFTTVEELKAKLLEVMEKEARARSERELDRQLEEALLKANRFPVPPSLVEAQLERQLERLRQKLLGAKGAWPEKELKEFREKLRPAAEDEVRMAYILGSIAEREKVQALEDDLRAEKEKSLSGARSDEERKDIERLFSERAEAISGMIRDRKTMELVRQKAVILNDNE